MRKRRREKSGPTIIYFINEAFEGEEEEGFFFVSGDDHVYVNEEPTEDLYFQSIGNLQREGEPISFTLWEAGRY